MTQQKMQNNIWLLQRLRVIISHTKSTFSVSPTISCLAWFCAAALAAVEVISTAAQCEASKAPRLFTEHLI